MSQPRVQADLDWDSLSGALRVRVTVTGHSFSQGEALAQLRRRVAGVPSAIGECVVTARDAEGLIPIEPVHDEEHWRWQGRRATTGTVALEYQVMPRRVDALTTDGHPPVDLRFEADGITGSTSAFLALPDLPGDVPGTLSWPGPSSVEDRHRSVDDIQAIHIMAGTVSTFTAGALTTYWLSPPTFDVAALTRHASTMHAGLADLFGEPTPPLSIFLRRNPYRGMSGSALPGCFIAGWHKDAARSDRLHAFVDHELVHDWLGVENEHDNAVWFNEGVADYYGIVLPHRLGLLDDETFHVRVDEIVRVYLASPWRDRPMADLAPRFWDDPRIHQLAYVRGMLYLAELERLLTARGDRVTLDDLMRRLRDRRMSGSAATLDHWKSWVVDAVGDDDAQLLEGVLDGQMSMPAGDLWRTGRTPDLETVPVIDPGFSFSTFVTRVVTGLDSDGLAAQAGLRDGDELLDLPPYSHLLGVPANREITVTARRGATSSTHTFPVGRETVPVPQWARPQPDGHRPTVR